MMRGRLKSIGRMLLIAGYGVGCSFFTVSQAFDLWLLGTGVVWVIYWFLYKQDTKIVEESQEILSEHQKGYKRLGYEISVASTQVDAVSKDLYVTLEEQTAFTEQLLAEAQEMTMINEQVNQNIEYTVANIKEVLRVQDEVGENTKQLEVISASSGKTIHRSLEEMLTIINHIKEIEVTSNSASKYMDQLNNAAEKIVYILETVSQISSQTHMLALNASIESARAGEAGKGFAVVSEEIRKLAGNTANAVGEIKELIDGIMQALTNANQHLHKNQEKVEAGVNESITIEGSLKEAQYAFERVSGLVEKITSLSSKEIALAKSVNVSINHVEANSEELAQSVTSVFESIHKQKDIIEGIVNMGELLGASSKDLMALIDEYKLNDLSEYDTASLEMYQESFHALVKELTSHEAFRQLDKATHQRLLEEVIKKNDFIEAIWTNGHKGRFVVSIPPAGIANGSVRQWFKEGIKGHKYMSKPYISSITKTPCVTLSAPIKMKDGTIRGVIGIDIKL